MSEEGLLEAKADDDQRFELLRGTLDMFILLTLQLVHAIGRIRSPAPVSKE